MGTSWGHLGASIVASFTASLVECVEALTVVLAVGSSRGWRSALTGTASAIALLSLIILLGGRALTRVPLHIVQFIVGVLLVMFGLRWLRKAILRSAHLLPFHDEDAVFTKSVSTLNSVSGRSDAWDKVAFAASFNITMLEGAEVVFIVVAIGAGGTNTLLAAGLGAMVALLVVSTLGLMLHRPLTRIPENALKFVVGVLLSAFGTFWVGEGMDLEWPGADWCIPGLIAGYLAIGLMLVLICRRLSLTQRGSIGAGNAAD
jgi:Ca2+/H+ antiporter, TMEM165/GDT1 family